VRVLRSGAPYSQAKLALPKALDGYVAYKNQVKGLAQSCKAFLQIALLELIPTGLFFHPMDVMRRVLSMLGSSGFTQKASFDQQQDATRTLLLCSINFPRANTFCILVRFKSRRGGHPYR